MNDTKHTVRRGYPLNTLFLLIAACAVVAGMVAPLVRGNLGRGIGVGEVVVSGIVGGILLAGIGALVGLFHYSRVNGASWGVLVGALLGAVFGPALFIPPKEFSLVLGTSIGGAVLVVAVAAAIRLTTDYGRTREVVDDDVVQAEEVKPKRHPLDPDPDEDEEW
jgi:hypothetical protein